MQPPPLGLASLALPPVPPGCSSHSGQREFKNMFLLCSKPAMFCQCGSLSPHCHPEDPPYPPPCPSTCLPSSHATPPLALYQPHWSPHCSLNMSGTDSPTLGHLHMFPLPGKLLPSDSPVAYSSPPSGLCSNVPSSGDPPWPLY